MALPMGTLALRRHQALTHFYVTSAIRLIKSYQGNSKKVLETYSSLILALLRVSLAQSLGTMPKTCSFYPSCKMMSNFSAGFKDPLVILLKYKTYREPCLLACYHTFCAWCLRC